jgi:transcriptional regulator GlxA family with amidase domain
MLSIRRFWPNVRTESEHMTTRRIGFIGFDGVTLLDLAGPHEVFATANALDRSRGVPPYETILLAAGGQPFVSDSGLALTPQKDFTSAGRFDTLITPGGPGLREPDIQAQVADWLRFQATQTRRMVSVCTGLFGLAASGLLDGRRAATHWEHAKDAARQFPLVSVDPNVLYLADPPFYTSAGITAGIDLALALVEEDCGSALALAIARELVVYFKRPGGQAQFSRPLQFQARATERFADLVAWLPENLQEDLTLPALAERVHSSPRNFARLFKQTFGMTATAYVEMLRLDAARERIGAGGHTLDAIAASVGFRSADVFRRAFERRFGIAPSHYAKCFSPPG